MRFFKNRKLTLLFFSSLSFLFLVGAGFSTWWFPFVPGEPAEGESKIEAAPVDEIMENYHFVNNTYTLVFFSQPANPDAKPSAVINADGSFNINYTPRTSNSNNVVLNERADAWGSWADANGATGANPAKYGYKTLIVEQNPTAEQINSLGSLNTTRIDLKGYPFYFEGWMNDVTKSAEYAKGVTGTNPVNPFTFRDTNSYPFVDLQGESLESLDNADDPNDPNEKAADGTNKNDHIIFLYPIFSSGKSYNTTTYNKNNLYVRLDSGSRIINIEGQNRNVPSKAYYFKQNYEPGFGDSSTLQSVPFWNTYYSLKGFRINHGDQYRLSFDLPGQNDSIGSWRTFDWSKPSQPGNAGVDSTPLLDTYSNNVDEIPRDLGSGQELYFIIGNNDALTNNSTTQFNQSTFLSAIPGLYNIYVYATITGTKISSNALNTAVDSTTRSPEFNSLAPDSFNFIKNATYMRAFDGNTISYKGTPVTKPTIPGYGSDYKLWITVKVEMNEEVNMFSQSLGSFNLSSSKGLKLYNAESDFRKRVKKVEGHGGATKAVDYYRLNVPVLTDGEMVQADSVANNRLYNNKYIGLSSSQYPLADTSSLVHNLSHEIASASEINVINAYSFLKDPTTNTPLLDYQTPYGVDFPADSGAEANKKIQFGAGGSGNNVKWMDTDANASNAGFNNVYNKHHFFQPITPTAPNAYYYDPEEFHLVVRLYYGYTENVIYQGNPQNFGTSTLTGIGVIAIPRKIRKWNTFYLISKNDKAIIDKNKGVNNGMIDIKTLIDELRNSPTAGEYYTAAVTDAKSGAHPFGSFNIFQYNTTTNRNDDVGTLAQLFQKAGMKKIYDLLKADDLKPEDEYNANSSIDFEKTRIMLYE